VAVVVAVAVAVAVVVVVVVVEVVVAEEAAVIRGQAQGTRTIGSTTSPSCSVDTPGPTCKEGWGGCCCG
jgi:hypothetical protein